MEKQIALLLILPFLLLSTAGCNRAPATPAIDSQATIDAAVAATDAAQAAMQATIDAAVAATNAAQNAADAAVQATMTAQSALDATAAATTTAAAPATPIPSEVYVTMTEEELAALIDQSVNEAIAASDAYSTAATESTGDGTVTQEEVQSVEVYYANADQALAYAEELLYVYNDLYGDLAYEAIDELEDIENDLEDIAAAIEALNATMMAIESDLAAGLALAEETIAQVENAAQTVSQQVIEAQMASQAWQSSIQIVRENRPAVAPPVQVNGDPAVAIQGAIDFALAGQSALSDNQITPQEAAALAQQGAQVGANLNATGKPKLQELSVPVNAVSSAMSAGDLAQAQAQLQQLNTSLGALSALPELQGVQIPAVPESLKLPGGALPSVPGKPALPGGGSRPSRSN